MVIENMYTIEYKEECGRKYNKVSRHGRGVWRGGWIILTLLCRSATGLTTRSARRWWTRAATRCPPTARSRWAWWHDVRWGHNGDTSGTMSHNYLIMLQLWWMVTHHEARVSPDVTKSQTYYFVQLVHCTWSLFSFVRRQQSVWICKRIVQCSVFLTHT